MKIFKITPKPRSGKTLFTGIPERRYLNKAMFLGAYIPISKRLAIVLEASAN